MEKARISSYQLFVLIILFELGSALLLPLGVDARQDAWLAILLGMVGGSFIFLLHSQLFHYYPDMLPTTYMQKIIGKFFGRIIAFLYIVYFLYLASRILREFGEMLAITGYPETPLIFNHLLMLLVIIYAARKGIEVIARTGELLFVFIYILAIGGFILIIMSGLIDLKNLKPFLEDGFKNVAKVAFSQVMFFPFGEIIAFSMIFPYLNNPKKLRITGLLGLWLAGANLAISMGISISVLGIDKVIRSYFPLLGTIQSIQIAQFLERLDIFFMLSLVILGFFKICILFYAAMVGTADLFKIDRPGHLAFPIGFIVLFFSIALAQNIVEHMKEGLQIVPLFIQLPFQVIFPLLLFIIAFYKNKKKRNKQQRKNI